MLTKIYVERTRSVKTLCIKKKTPSEMPSLKRNKPSIYRDPILADLPSMYDGSRYFERIEYTCSYIDPKNRNWGATPPIPNLIVTYACFENRIQSVFSDENTTRAFKIRKNRHVYHRTNKIWCVCVPFGDTKTSSIKRNLLAFTFHKCIRRICLHSKMQLHRFKIADVLFLRTCDD